MNQKPTYGGPQSKELPTGGRFDANSNKLALASDDFREEDVGVEFDPAIHLNYSSSAKHYTMQELGLADGNEISPIGATHQFTLFSEQAVRIMRHEILNPKSWPRCSYKSVMAQCHLRGYAKDYAPFTYAAFNHPKTLEVISREAGIELQPVMDYEIASVNFVVDQPGKESDTDTGSQVVDWHYDSHPFVCVVMLSDTTHMVGGETVFKNQVTGELQRIPDPKQGSATIIQGKYIEHQALKPRGGTERITTVTSMVPKDRLKYDASTMTTTACVSNCNELFQEWSCYRLERIGQRLRQTRNRLLEARKQDKFDYRFDLDEVTQFIQDQQDYLGTTVKEMQAQKQYLQLNA